MTGSPTRAISLRTLLSLSIILILASSCGPKVPPPPPEFNEESRAPTGNARLEDSILEAARLEALTREEVIELEAEVQGEFVSEALLSSYVAVMVDRNRLGDAIKLLHTRAWRAVEDHGKAADSLGLAMGQLRWGACAQMARDYLTLRHSSGAFLVRALCLERSGQHEAAVENLRAADELMSLGAERLEQLIDLVEARGSSAQLRPGDRAVYDDLMLEMSQRGILDQLFAQHLMGYWPERPLGSLDPGGITPSQLEEVLQSRARSYRHCYHLADSESGRRAHIRGTAVIEFEVSPLGSLRDARVVLADWADHPRGSELNGCLMEQMKRLRFPRPRYGLTQVSRHKFAFQPD